MLWGLMAPHRSSQPWIPNTNGLNIYSLYKLHNSVNLNGGFIRGSDSHDPISSINLGNILAKE